jgi:magnesium and cobalt exporter, CNNM family
MEIALILFVAVFIPLIFSAIFSASETAITSVSSARIYKLKADGNKKAELIAKLSEDKENLIGSILLANNALNIFASSFAAVLALKLFGDEGVFISTFSMTVIIIVFAEVLPKTYAIENAEKVALFVAPFLVFIVKILYPLTNLIKRFVNLVFRLFNFHSRNTTKSVAGTEELRGAIEYHHHEGSVKKSDRDMLGSVLDLADTDVDEIMVHRKNIVSVDVDLKNEAIIAHILESGHTRVPLWRENPENIVAVIHIKDLLKGVQEHNGDIEELMIINIATEPWFIPETTSLREQLDAFREKRNHFALVIDEYGALRGLVTLNDILEEIVGRIEDEHIANSDIKHDKEKGECIIKGMVTVRDVNRVLDWSLPDDKASTVAGLLINEIERIPDEGEEFVFHNTRFSVLKKVKNQITLLKLTILKGNNL